MKRRGILPTAILALFPAVGSADLVTLNVGDGFGTSSFDAAGNWSNVLAPSAGNNYEVSVRYLRTPTTGVSHTFAGDSLTLKTGGSILYKGGVSQTITSTLILDGGEVRSGQSPATTLTLAGTINVTATGGGLSPDQSPFIINSVVSGTGQLWLADTVAPFGDFNVSGPGHLIAFNAANTFTGNLRVDTNTVGATLSDTSTWAFNIGANGVNNTIFGVGRINLNGLFSFDLTGAGTTLGDTWTLVNHGTLTETYGSTFAVSGFIEGGISLSNNLDLPVRNSGMPSLQNISGINTLSGNVVIPVGGSGLTIQSDAGTLNLTGTTFNVLTSAFSRTLIFTGAGDGSVSWPISNGAALSVAVTKDGAGTWTLSGSNTCTGNTTVTDGTLVITNDDVLADTSTVTLPATGSLNLTHSGTDTVTGLIIGGVPQSNGLYTFNTGKLKVGLATPFEDWAILKGLDGTAGKENGPADDPDKDGTSNLAEFAFNGNPLSGSDNGQIYVLTADSDVDSPDTAKELILTLAARKTTPAFTAGAPATAPLTDGVNYSVHGSTDLASFGVTVTPVGFVDPGVALTDATNYEFRSFSLNGSNGLAGKGFLRAISTAP